MEPEEQHRAEPVTHPGQPIGKVAGGNGDGDGNGDGESKGASDATGAMPEQEMDRLAQPVDTEQPPRLPFPVVGIGASAGGLEAFTEFFSAMRPDSGMAFVLIQHLPPERESHMVDILARRTTMPVTEVLNGITIHPDHVYMIRPGKTLTIQNGKLWLGESLARPGHSRPVDDFFRSLAEEQRERAIAVVMSGMGSNGTAGAQAIKAVGGLCVAQDPESSQYPSMPRHVIDQGYADFVMRPRDMPEALLRYAGHPYATGGREASALAFLEQQAFTEVLAVLRTRTKQDFSAYKRPTLFRRIQRRMGLSQVTQLDQYARLLRQNPTEVRALADDLLIHVTGFFRDPDAWEALRTRIIQPLVAERENDSTLRCWVTACSSGEEAYTLAMLLAEASAEAGKSLDIKVFATDMAERSLQHARTGVYPGGIEAEVTPERLERYFDKDDAVYRVKKEVREIVVFAPQNVLQDPPFSKIDIATCRNLLIYLEPEVQRRVLAMLHFGLREGGALFLGTSETVGGSEELFEPIDKVHRIFRRIGPTRRGRLDFPFPSPKAIADAASTTRHAVQRLTLAQMAQRALLEQYTPASVVVDREQRIVYYHGDTDRFLTQPRGEPTRDIMSLARDHVRGAVRTAVYNAAATEEAVTARDGLISSEKNPERVWVKAAPLDRKNLPGFLLVTFEVRGEFAPSETQLFPPEQVGDHAALTDELERVREELQSTIEQLQTSNEELKASNEEVTSINEELQSANEELETSKEELQSLNEELTTVNTQLQIKVEEHEAASNDLQSLLSSADIAVIFLDPQFRIRRFTPAVRELVDILHSDTGRPLKDLARKFEDPDLLADAERVLAKFVPIEHEVQSHSKRWYARRVLPYRTSENNIDGVVITFVDVTARKCAEVEIAAAREYAESIVETLHEPLVVLNSDLTVQKVNAAFYAHFRVMPADTIGRKIYDLGNRQWDIPELRTLLEKVLPERKLFNDYKVEHDFDGVGRRVMLLNGRQLDHVQLILLGVRDISEQDRADKELRRSEERLQRMMKVEGVGVMIFDTASGALIDCNETFLQMTGYSREQVRNKTLTWHSMTPSEYAKITREQLEKLEKTGRIGPYEKEYTRRDGSRAWMLFAGAALGDGTVVEYCIDIGDRQHAGSTEQENAERLRLVLEGARDFAIIMLDPDNRITLWSAGAERLFGWKADEAVGQNGNLIFTPEDRAVSAAEEELSRATLDGKANDERWHLRKDGSRFWASGVMHALRSNGDQPRGFVKVLRDETDRREAEDALRLAKDAAEQANRTKDEFLATVSHELRTPVSAVLLWTNLLLSGHASPEQIAEGLKAVKSSAEAQRELINDLMDSSRISAGKLRIQLRLTALAELVKSAVETILPTATIKGVNVVANLSPDVGTVMADPDRLQQVMWNLLTNAVKFTPAGGRVDVILQRSRGGVEIRVIDNGSGIAPEFLPHVFEAFRQGEGSTTRIHGGLGLGLAITKQLVELHGGTVRAESSGLGKGSTFIVSLPLAALAASRPRQRTIREAAAAKPGEPVSLSDLRIMLLEDDPDTRNALMLILRSAGAEVVAFESVAPAMEAVKGTPPDVIVSDIGLPGEDGFSFMRRLRKQEASSGKPPVPAIALTAFSRDQDRQQAAESGFQAYLGKPVKEEELLATIREVARRK